ncbi:ABC transporter permease [Desulfitibacter alkalitolerans]|uniref:ABC transporter permease n=1 Tax=Desulfitibacter alkalitolerans TaxID=264641 RepID=UPI000489161C|nr:ABC transporter permease subunit [Desulfitibacter alkalitolerans]
MEAKQLFHKTMVLIFFFLLMFPFLILLLWAFTKQWPAGNVLPLEWGLRGWQYILSPNNKILSAIGTSISLSLAVTLAAVVISIPAGKALGLYEFPGKGLIEILVLAPIIIPPITIGMGIHVIFIKYGLVDTFLGVLLIHLVVVMPYGIRIFASVYKAMGLKWEEQSRVLKAKGWQRFFYVTLPFLRPGLISSGILMFNVSFSQYFLTFLIGGGKIVTLPLVLFPYVNSGDRVIGSVISLIFILIALVFMLVIEKVITDPKQQSQFYYL